MDEDQRAQFLTDLAAWLNSRTDVSTARIADGYSVGFYPTDGSMEYFLELQEEAGD